MAAYHDQHTCTSPLQALKVLAREPAARQAFSERGVRALVLVLAAGPEAPAAAEAANALLNLCYERQHVNAVSATKHALCHGLLQGLGWVHPCFYSLKVHNKLSNTHRIACKGCVTYKALHNNNKCFLAAACQVLQSGGLRPLVELLGAADQDVQANAAGAIQSVCFQVGCLAWPIKSMGNTA